MVSIAFPEGRSHLDTHGSLLEDQLPYGEGRDSEHKQDEYFIEID